MSSHNNISYTTRYKNTLKEVPYRYQSVYKTPRTEYYTSYLSKPPVLLEKNPIFQIYYNTVQQFVNYVNIYPSQYKSKQYPDCFINSLFALGLRDVSTLNTDIRNIYTQSPTEGILISNICVFLEDSFGLPRYSVYTETFIDSSQRNVYSNISKTYSKGIHPHYATIIFLHKYNKSVLKKKGHVIIVFNHEGVLWYFDPQINILSKTIDGIQSNDEIMLGYSIFMVSNVNTPRILVKSSYALPIY